VWRHFTPDNRTAVGLREPKEEQTRQRIAETAHRLFGASALLEHGLHDFARAQR
jgi:hypothetical protein